MMCRKMKKYNKVLENKLPIEIRTNEKFLIQHGKCFLLRYIWEVHYVNVVQELREWEGSNYCNFCYLGYPGLEVPYILFLNQQLSLKKHTIRISKIYTQSFPMNKWIKFKISCLLFNALCTKNLQHFWHGQNIF